MSCWRGLKTPEKLIKLMIREMEDTVVELKASCAGVIARASKTRRQLEEIKERAKVWEGRAELAVNKGRDDLAREALMEKRKYAGRVQDQEQELIELDALVGQYHEDIRQLEEKLQKARDKQRMLGSAPYSRGSEATRSGGHSQNRKQRRRDEIRGP